MNAQLTMDGREEEVRTGGGTSAPFTPAQREILRLVQVYGTVTSTAAGRIIHAHRDGGCLRCRESRCKFAASDGGDALKRLMARGVVRRCRPGVWVMVG